jgi:hypothetical protein
MDAIVELERQLGYEPRDVSAQNAGMILNPEFRVRDVYDVLR